MINMIMNNNNFFVNPICEETASRTFLIQRGIFVLNYLFHIQMIIILIAY